MTARDSLPLGIFPRLPSEQYHASPGVSCSGLHDFARSPAHYFGLHLDPKRPAPEEKAGQLEGTLAHCAILEPGELALRYQVGPNVSRATKVWKDFEAAWANQPGVTCIKREQVETAMCQAEAVRALPDVAALLARGLPEVSAFWIDPATGELCRCRPDWVHPVSEHDVILLDVKTYSDASPREFQRQVARKGYHRQAAWYSDGYALASGKRVLGFVFVAVETHWPFAACASMLDDDSLDKGRQENRDLLARYAECRAANTWPGYGSAIELISLPAWAA